MSSEHEGGAQGAPQDAQQPAVPVEDTVVLPHDLGTVAPPVDPTLAGFPPPVPPAPQAPDAHPTAVQPAVAESPAIAETTVQPTVPQPQPQPQPLFPVQPAPVAAEHVAAEPVVAEPVAAAHAAPVPSAPGPAAGQPYGQPYGQPAYSGHPEPAAFGEQAPPGYPPLYPSAFPPAPEPRKKGRGGLIALLAATAIVAGGIGGGVGAALENNDSSGGSTPVSTTIDPKALSRPPESIAGIAAKALPSVVTISASNSQESGTGTGFVYDTEGHILTNNHVVAPSENGGKLSVKFSDGSSYPATIVGRASGYDVAVIKLSQTPKKPLVPLALGNSDQVAVGDTTIAIGAPFGLSGTVTSGIVSAKNRPVASGDETGAQTSYMNALQTDASINPGNSGGPLMNAQGQVIGIDSAIQSTGSNSGSGGGQAGSIGLGFAIPINQAKWVADQLIKTGKPTYPIIGVLRDDAFTGTGAKIASAPVQGQAAITPGGPADKAGLQPGDVITELGGVAIDNGPTLVSEIWSHHPGDVVTVTYTRGGTSHSTTLTLGSRVGDQ